MERCDTCQYIEGLFDSHWASVSSRNVCVSFCKLLPENPKKHEDSIIPKEIQGVGSTLDFLEISDS